MKVKTTYARRSSGFARLGGAAAMLLLLLNPNAASGQTTATTEQLAALKVLFNAHNLPITPLGVP
jgi:hypothetical protein